MVVGIKHGLVTIVLIINKLKNMHWPFRKLKKHTIDELDNAINDLKVLIIIDWGIWISSWKLLMELWKDFESGKFNTGAYNQTTRVDEERLIAKMVDSIRYKTNSIYEEIEQFFKLLWWYHVIDRKTGRRFRSICKRMKYNEFYK